MSEVTPAPLVDPRTEEALYREVAEQLWQRLGVRVPQDPLAEALLRIFARYSTVVVERLNRVPEKNFLAFLDTLELSPLPATPAEVPVTFTPVKQLPGGRWMPRVPEGTQVAASGAVGAGGPIVFETARPLALSACELRRCVRVDPESRTVVHGSAASSANPPALGAEEAFTQELLIGIDPAAIVGAVNALVLSVATSGSAPGETAALEWAVVADAPSLLTPHRDSTAGLTHSGEVAFSGIPIWPVAAIAGKEAHWLVCRRRAPRPVCAQEEAGPGAIRATSMIERLAITLASRDAERAIDAAFWNAVPLDLSLAPFALGERPRFGDTFSLCSAAFGRRGSQVTLRIQLTNPSSAGPDSPLPPVSRAGCPRLQWEYPLGKSWSPLGCEDGTDHLTQDGFVAFRVPEDVETRVVNGVEGYWVRARLAGGHYGGNELRMLPVSEELTGIPRTATASAPPSLRAVGVVAASHAADLLPSAVLYRDSLSIQSLEAGRRFAPFAPLEPDTHALYLGLAVPPGHEPSLWEDGIDLYVEPAETAAAPAVAASLLWQYRAVEGWRELQVADETRNLSQRGIVQLRFGADAASWVDSRLDPTLYWIRALSRPGAPPVAFRELLLNTVLAHHLQTTRNEVLGSSTGRPDQRFYTTRSPLLPGAEIQVKEQRGADIRRRSTNSQEYWENWASVPSLAASGPLDRHYTLDLERGEVRFGDGRHGCIPPAGIHNIRIAQYRTGGGAAGNVPVGQLTQLRTSVPYVMSVRNPRPAIRGENSETWDQIQERGARWLRHRERAITREDYEDLARLASRSIARVKCLPCGELSAAHGVRHAPGAVGLLVVPRSSDLRPSPSPQLLRQVCEYVAQHAPSTVRLHAAGPEYVAVRVEAIVVPEHRAAGAAVLQTCKAELQRYLHPLRGGAKGTGWEFGEQPHVSDVIGVLESQPGVRHVRSVAVRLETPPGSGVPNAPLSLVCSGEHRLRLAP